VRYQHAGAGPSQTAEPERAAPLRTAMAPTTYRVRGATEVGLPTAIAVPTSTNGHGRAAVAETTSRLRLARPAFRAWKRSVDLVVSGVALILLAPVMVLIAAALLVFDGRPIFYRQFRVGRARRAFKIVKFRTMRVGAEAELHAHPALHARYISNGYKLRQAEDPRITRFGRFLRRTSLDELPQLFNVLIGQMSLVGPRPLLDTELERVYGAEGSFYEAVRPGMTGVWQVRGRAVRNGEPRKQLELDYICNWSPMVDVRVLAATPRAVLSRQGAE
jgi:exopolysaccharide production protein ExoY